MYSLAGKIALVTGAGGVHGIGRVIARRLAEEGADVAVNDLPQEVTASWGGLSTVADEITRIGRQSIPITGSVAVSADVERVVGTVLSEFGRIDILVNNAGAPAGPDRVPVVELDEEVFDGVQAVNVKGTFLMSRSVAKHMIDRDGGGRIINISSVSGKMGVAKSAAYCASKFAVIGFTQSLALELAQYRVTVNAICPGLVETERVLRIASALKTGDLDASAYRDEMLRRSSQANPLGRVGKPGDVARMAAWLASEEADYMTGQAINVSGGAFMG